MADKMPSTQTLTELMSLSVSMEPPIRKRNALTTSSLDKKQSTSLDVQYTQAHGSHLKDNNTAAGALYAWQ